MYSSPSVYRRKENLIPHQLHRVEFNDDPGKKYQERIRKIIKLGNINIVLCRIEGQLMKRSPWEYCQRAIKQSKKSFVYI